VGITLANASVATVNEQLRPLMAGDRASGVDRLLLGGMNRGSPLAAGPANRPSAVVRDNMLIAFAHRKLPYFHSFSNNFLARKV
jgi:hypothetical protein